MPRALITGLSFTGEGIGRVDGKVVFIPFSLPGEVVEWKLTESRKTYDWGLPFRILEPSPDRIEPPCPFFLDCGGCQLQHLDPFKQGQEKERLFREALAHALKSDEVPMNPALTSAEGFGYRHRLQLKMAWKNNRPAIGFFGRKSHQVIPVDRCLLANEAVNTVLGPIGETLRYLAPVEGTPEIELQVYEEPRKGGIVLKFSKTIGQSRRRDLTRALLSIPGLDYVLFRENDSLRLVGEHPFNPEKDSPEFFVPAFDSRASTVLRLKCFPLVFTQANLALNRCLISRLRDLNIFNGRDTLADFYCGLGNISLPLSLLVQKVIGIEAFPPAVANARWNQELNGISNCTFIQGQAGQVGSLLKSFGKNLTWIFLDPPRSGAKDMISLLGSRDFDLKGILYLSCNPMTLGRDLSLLVQNGWKVQWSQVVDFFPQTFHQESLTLLKR
jgi:23S rRNA (uracil1939-C5)-methyltransferase